MTPGLESCHALVLNADFRPLSYFPLSIWSWQDAVKAVFLDRVSVISEYERKIHSPSFEMKLPSVIALKEYVPAARRPAFTRFNVFLRDHFNCQYCGGDFATNELTFDHVVPKSRGGRTMPNGMLLMSPDVPLDSAATNPSGERRRAVTTRANSPK